MKYLEYYEKKDRGTREFPLEFYHLVPTHPRYEMSYHWHMECEFIHILEGSFLLTIDNEKYTLTEGDIVYLPSGVLHGGMPDNSVYECIVFDLSALLRTTKSYYTYLQSILNNSLIIQSFFSKNKHPKLHEIVCALFNSAREKSLGFELTCYGHLFRFYGYILEKKYYTTSTDITKRNNKKIIQLKNAIELIETSYNTCLTLDDLANAANMNPKYFCRIFQEMTARTPIDYLNYYRIEVACFQLATTSDSITNISFNCGFNDLSYFIKTFKKYKGVTPKKYVVATL